LELFPLIILAAGKSSRMGVPKGLLEWQGQSWLEEQLSRFALAGGSYAVVVLGYQIENYQQQLPWVTGHINNWKQHQESGLCLGIAVNPDPARGMFSSLQIGIHAILNRLSLNHKGSFVLPIDVPAPEARIWTKLQEVLLTQTAEVSLPRFDDEKRGHPVLLSQSFSKRLLLLEPHQRLDYEIAKLGKDEVHFSDFLDHADLNLNTPNDWNQFKISQTKI